MFTAPIDIANRALQHLGATRIDESLGFSEQSVNASETSFAYFKLRRPELRRNVWRFAIRRAVLRPLDTNTMFLAPTLWVPTTTYFVGSVVSDQNGVMWISKIPNNLGNDPTQTSAWEEYFGPISVSKYDPTTTYFAGEIVYTAGAGDGSYNVYYSLQNSNTIDPSLPNQWSPSTVYYQNQVVQVFPAWSNVPTYAQGAAVTYTDGNTYASLINGNTNNIPPSSPSAWARIPVLTLTSQPVPSTQPNTPPQSSPVIEWSPTTNYALGAVVMFNGTEYLSTLGNNTNNYPNVVASPYWEPITGGTLYMSLIDLNLNQPPASSPAAWTTAFVQGGGNSMWTQIGGSGFPMGVALQSPNITYPVTTGPTWLSTTRQAYRLPHGFLRLAPQDPKAGSTSYLGQPTNLEYVDWIFEGNFIVSRFNQPIMLRFVADVRDVRAMDDMFCEGLAARIGYETCERITQSVEKLKTLISVYQDHMSTARLVNGIETSATEPPLDDYIATRL
jgi:hypothetical protein